MKKGDLVKFAKPNDKDEQIARMLVTEERGERVLVSDQRFADWRVPPTSVYLKSELKILKWS